MAENQAIDWSYFKIEIPVQEKDRRVVEAWVTQRGIESWFLRSAKYKAKNGDYRSPKEKVQPGDTYAWRWHGWPDTMEEYGEILEPREGEFFPLCFWEGRGCKCGAHRKSGR